MTMPMSMKLSFQRGVPRVAVLRGFTLVELMVTLAVAAVLAMVAVPGMTQLFRSARLSTQTDQLVSALNLARLEAVKQRKDIQLCGAANPADATNCTGVAAADWTNGWVIFDGVDVMRRFDGKMGLRVTTLVTSVTFNGTIGSATAPSFTATDSSTATGSVTAVIGNGSVASFILCISGEKEQQVDVALSGHVSKRTNSTKTCT
jgi:type IV fimbrial biogenesis protein FimT